jgi:hypothetical protein
MKEADDRQQQALPKTKRVLKQQFWKTEVTVSEVEHY